MKRWSTEWLISAGLILILNGTLCWEHALEHHIKKWILRPDLYSTAGSAVLRGWSSGYYYLILQIQYLDFLFIYFFYPGNVWVDRNTSIILLYEQQQQQQQQRHTVDGVVVAFHPSLIIYLWMICSQGINLISTGWNAVPDPYRAISNFYPEFLKCSFLHLISCWYIGNIFFINELIYFIPLRAYKPRPL